MEPLTFLGLVAVAAVSALIGLSRRQKPEAPASRAAAEIKRVGTNARTEINAASSQYIKNVRNNTRR